MGKTWQLESSTGPEGYLYYCTLCDEALILSPQEIHPRKISLVFDGTCPGCGFQLDDLLGCQTFRSAEELYANPRCRDPESLLEENKPFRSSLTKSSLLDHDPQPDLTTGISQFDRALVLKLGQLVVLQGRPAHDISLLLCARAIASPNLNSDVVFVDGGNLFDTYAISNYSIILGQDLEKIRDRVHLSRAFTHHQLAQLCGEKLASAIKEYSAKLAVVSDITQLYCDPDVRDTQEALDIFTKSVKFLATLAEQSNALTIVTNLESRNNRMENSLLRSGHAFAKLEDRDSSTKMTVVKHPFMVQREPVRFDPQTLLSSLDEHFR